MNAALYDKLQLQHEYIVTKDYGSRVLIDGLTEALNAEYATEVSSKIIEDKIKNPDKSQRFIKNADDPIGSKKSSAAFIHNYIIDHVKKVYKSCKENGIDPMNTELYFIGGTSELLRDEIIEVFGDDVHFLPNSSFVNADGWLTMLRSYVKKAS